MSTGEQRLADLFRKYLDNTCTKEELDELLAKFDEQKNKAVLLAQLKQLWMESNYAASPDVDWDKVYNRIMNIAAEPSTQQAKKQYRFRSLGVAAGISLLAGMVAFGFYWSTKDKKEAKAQVVESAQKHQQAGPGHQLINLPDGSIVLLNNNSKLDYPASFKGKTREVFLTGEAWFKIKPNPDRPFLVHTGSITTKVLGTSFNIKAYPVDDKVSVTVTQGKVEVRDKKQTLGILKKNQQITIDKVARTHEQEEVIAEEVLTWKKGDLIMDDITFEEAVKKIAEIYQVQITLQNPKLKNCRFTATFLNQASLEQVLNVLCDLNNAAWSLKQEGLYVVTGEGCG
jgi:transmembrane sensor